MLLSIVVEHIDLLSADQVTQKNDACESAYPLL
jgi:hypothetical protein